MIGGVNLHLSKNSISSIIRIYRAAYCSDFSSADCFARKHIGPDALEQQTMLQTIGCKSLEEMSDKIVPKSIRCTKPLDLPQPMNERRILKCIAQIASMNQLWKCYIGMGFYDCVVPSVIRRNMFENLTWLTSYTPYQAEIAQGRLESLMNFQTMICEMTGLDVSNASLLDEATACAETMQMCSRATGRFIFLVDEGVHPQNIAVCRTRAKHLGIQMRIISDWKECDFKDVSGVLMQYPNTEGAIVDLRDIVSKVQSHGGLFTVATDLMACALIPPPGDFGADVCVGNAQRFGVPLGYGGPHAAFMAISNRYKHGALIRSMPGRIVGLSRDSNGDTAYRLTLQTREQHIRRGKATSNICTAQALLANMSAMYAIYHGPKGIERIASRIHNSAVVLAEGLVRRGFRIAHHPFFDTVKLEGLSWQEVQKLRTVCESNRINVRYFKDKPAIGISLDETVDKDDVLKLIEIFQQRDSTNNPKKSCMKDLPKRQTAFLRQKVFNNFHSEQMFLRYMKQLQNKDVSLADSAIPLGSCTMKLNSAIQLTPCSWPEFTNLHPFVPREQAQGYHRLFEELEKWLCEITGFDNFSFQSNSFSGAQGEYSGLLAIRGYLASIGQSNRKICLIPASAHGTNPASSQMAGLTAVTVGTDPDGNICWQDLRDKVAKNADRLACMMITYPSTYGIFDHRITDICKLIHDQGGQVYLDGANMNAQVGLCRPGDYGFDVAHLNLHKTFCIPHGGGGPGMGPVGVKKHLASFLPCTSMDNVSEGEGYFISAAPFGSASLLPIVWVYIASMGADGLREASQVAMLNANYMTTKLQDHYRIIYRGCGGFIAHEFLLDCRDFKKTANIDVVDIAKRLMDYGFHAPTVSFPVGGCLMIEPTESENKEELDWLCEALIKIRHEIAAIECGKNGDDEKNVLKLAPHTLKVVAGDAWDRPYHRSLAGYPTIWSARKIWPSVGRIDEPYGDRHLICTRQ